MNNDFLNEKLDYEKVLKDRSYAEIAKAIKIAVDAFERDPHEGDEQNLRLAIESAQKMFPGEDVLEILRQAVADDPHTPEEAHEYVLHCHEDECQIALFLTITAAAKIIAQRFEDHCLEIKQSGDLERATNIWIKSKDYQIDDDMRQWLCRLLFDKDSISDDEINRILDEIGGY